MCKSVQSDGILLPTFKEDLIERSPGQDETTTARAPDTTRACNVLAANLLHFYQESDQEQNLFDDDLSVRRAILSRRLAIIQVTQDC